MRVNRCAADQAIARFDGDVRLFIDPANDFFGFGHDFGANTVTGKYL